MHQPPGGAVRGREQCLPLLPQHLRVAEGQGRARRRNFLSVHQRRHPGRERHEPRLRLLRRQQQSGPESADRPLSARWAGGRGRPGLPRHDSAVGRAAGRHHADRPRVRAQPAGSDLHLDLRRQAPEPVMEGPRMRGLWRQGGDERGMVLVIALFMMAILLMTGVFLVRMSSTEGDIAYNAMWSEGSFYAADAAINVGLDQITPTNTNMIVTALFPAPPALTPFTATGTIGFSRTARLPAYSMA